MIVQLTPPEDQVTESDRQHWLLALRSDFMLALSNMPATVRHVLEDEIRLIVEGDKECAA